MKILLLIFATLFIAPVYGHKASDSYLSIYLDTENLLRWDIALQDLQAVIDLDVNQDGGVSWEELNQLQNIIYQYANSKLSISSESKECKVLPQQIKINNKFHNFIYLC